MTTTDGKYDVNDVKVALRDIASRHPDKRSECRYRDRGTGAPQCVIGHLLAELGLYEVLAQVENSAGVKAFVEEDEPYNDDFASTFTDAAVDFMGRVQEQQDDGATWGEALVRHDNGFDLNAVR